MRQVSEGELDQLASELVHVGICVVRELFSRAFIDNWAAAFARIFDERRAQPGALAARDGARFYNTLPWVDPFADPQVFANPAILGVVQRVLGRDHVMVQMGADTPLRGSDYQEVHRDHPPLFHEELVTPLFAL